MMPRHVATCPLPASAVVDLYFLEHRAKVLDLAAFFDRVDRAAGARPARADYRLQALRQALEIVLEKQPGRAARVLRLLSDPTTQPIAHAPGKSAAGAPRKRPAQPPGAKTRSRRRAGGKR